MRSSRRVPSIAWRTTPTRSSWTARAIAVGNVPGSRPALTQPCNQRHDHPGNDGDDPIDEEGAENDRRISRLPADRHSPKDRSTGECHAISVVTAVLADDRALDPSTMIHDSR